MCIRDRVITFTDLDGRLLALKPDVTLSIAKNAQVGPGGCGRYYYQENVYRPSQESHTFREISQMGLECIGAVDDAAAAQVEMCIRDISEYGLSLLKEGDGVLTHCNAGPLATSRYGTAQGPFLLAAERGMHIRVFADETRPLLQGARLTSYEPVLSLIHI